MVFWNRKYTGQRDMRESRGYRYAGMYHGGVSAAGRGVRVTWLVLMLLLMLGAGQHALAAKSYVYYGKKLTGFDRQAYSAVVKSMGSSMDRVDVPVHGRVTYSSYIADIICADHPRYYWLGGFSLFSISRGSDVWLGYRPTEAWAGAFRTRKTFEKKTAAIVQGLKRAAKGKGAAQRAKLAHDYVVQHCVYRKSQYDQTAYGVFVKGRAVCAGYATAFKLLCDELGVPCICVVGTIGGEAHMVNYVKIGKNWYYVDTTWDDPGGGEAVRYNYFLVGLNTSRCVLTSNYGIALPRLAVNDYRK